MLHVVIVGAGQGGTRVLQALHGHPKLNVRCVVDVRPNAPGMVLARRFGVAVETDFRRAVPTYRGISIDVILEATGDEAVYHELRRLAGGIPVIAGNDLKFFMVLVEDKEMLIQQLRDRQQNLQWVLDATLDAMVGMDSDGRVTLYNRAAERIFGVTVEDAYGRPVQDIVPYPELLSIFQNDTVERGRRVKTGETEWLVSRVRVYGEHQQVVGAIATLRDVTELQRLAVEVTNLREIQTMLEAVIQSTQDAISVVDEHGRGMLINPAYTRLTGLTPEQVLNQPADVDIAEGESMHLQVLRTGKPVKGVPMKVGPHRREVIVNVAPIIVDGSLRGSVGVIHDVSEIKRLTEELDKANHLIRTLQAKYTFADIAGTSSALKLAVEQARTAAKTPATVLLRGESGTGKELFAHAIHNESNRRYRPFVRVNCAALSDTLLESELFGYEEGAFTGAKRGGKRGLFEEASGGTLFLDEIGELSTATQAKLLRALQEREIVRVGGTVPIPVDVRVIAATHVHLEQAVAAGRFREDLYYRINVVPIVIPPLRYRLEDLESLALRIIARQNQAFGRNVQHISAAAIEVLKEYHWPGNVRELENIIGQAMIRMGYHETRLEAHHLPLLPIGGGSAESAVTPAVASIQGTLDQMLARWERELIERVIDEVGGNKAAAARRLGISIRTLYYKLQRNKDG
nr:sigma 54-interacting transcriptional regulator [Alicyclobacillus contaminans]